MVDFTKMSVAQRVKYLIDEEKLFNQVRLASLMGVSAPTVSEHLKKGGDLPTKYLVEIWKNYKVLPNWLLTGEGEPLRENTELQRQNTIPDKEFVNGKEKRHENQLIPLYNLMAAAGLVTLFNSNHYILDYISIPNLPKCDGAVYVAGDSMYPLLKSGDIVIFRKVNNMPSGIRFGEMHVVDFMPDEDYITTVKYVHPSELGSDHIKLVSENRHHTPETIPLSKVRAIAVVKASIRINSMV